MNPQTGRQDDLSQQLSSSFLQLNPNPIIGVDAEGRITFLNTAAVGVLRCCGADASPGLFLPKDIAEILDALARHQRAAFQREVAIGDRIFEESVYVAPEHSLIGIFATDVTERKQAEEARERLTRTLTQNVDELRQLIYAASHDLRAPLVSVQGFVSELRMSIEEVKQALREPGVPPAVSERASAMVDNDVMEALRFVENGVTRLAVLLAGLLRLARLDRTSLVIAELDMNRLAADVLVAEEFQAKEAGARLEITDLPPCYGDAVLVSQVLANLIDNAIKYREPSRPLLVSITGHRSGTETVYTVADNGLGIAPAMHTKIFQLFYRVAPKKGNGDGLGLKIVKRIVDRLGGRIWVESEPDKSTRFHFALPSRRPALWRYQ
jgi:signal transduction histidine kinase